MEESNKINFISVFVIFETGH